MKEGASLQEAKTTLEKKYKTDVFNHICELHDLSELHKNKIPAICDVHADDIAKKDATIREYSGKLQELRKQLT